jgi:SpoVK/Ycf46/Vps4 family AAA+-type ATPase
MKDQVQALVRPIESVTMSDIDTLPDKSEALAQRVKTLLNVERSAAVLVFGPRGSGKTSFALHLARRIQSEFRNLRSRFINCAYVALYPDFADEGVALEDIEADLHGPPTNWLLILDELDAIGRSRPLSKRSSHIWAKIAVILENSRGETSNAIIATCQDPSLLDRAVVDKFDFIHYMAPVSLTEIQALLADVRPKIRNIDRMTAKIVSESVTRILAESNVERVAPHAFLKAYADFPRMNAPKTDPEAIARYVCTAGSSALLDQGSFRAYEDSNQQFILRSNLLNSLDTLDS